MSDFDPIHLVDAWQRGSNKSLEGFPREVDSLQDFRSLVGQLRQERSRDLVVRLYTRSSKHEVTELTEYIA